MPGCRVDGEGMLHAGIIHMSVLRSPATENLWRRKDVAEMAPTSHSEVSG